MRYPTIFLVSHTMMTDGYRLCIRFFRENAVPFQFDDNNTHVFIIIFTDAYVRVLFATTGVGLRVYRITVMTVTVKSSGDYNCNRNSSVARNVRTHSIIAIAVTKTFGRFDPHSAVLIQTRNNVRSHSCTILCDRRGCMYLKSQ